jgi:hypothetical protein
MWSALPIFFASSVEKCFLFIVSTELADNKNLSRA